MSAPARKAARSGALLLVPLLLFLCVFFAYPMIDTLARSLGAPDGFPTLANYQKILRRPIYLHTLQVTFEIALWVSLLTLALAYPLAFAMTRMRPWVAGLVGLAVMVPFATSVLVRTYAWMVILGPRGLINALGGLLGLAPLDLLYGRGAVLAGMAYTLLPYMVLLLFSVFRAVDPDLFRAARIFGASDLQTFRRVFLPLTLPGVAGGLLLVFVMALGYFVTPSLLGGPGDQMIAMLIYEQIDLTLDWKFGSALAILLLAAAGLVFAAYARLLGFRQLLENRS